MSEATEAQILEALKKVRDPEVGKDLVSLNMIKDVQICGDAVAFTLQLTTPAHPRKEEFEQDCKLAVGSLENVNSVNVRVTSHVTARPSMAGKMDIAGVKNIIAIASGKGGVGKSTVAVNIALALRKEGAKVGILDADIYGPSQPLMLGIPKAQPIAAGENKINPLEAHGLKVMSMGFLLTDDQAVVWRGPMIDKLLTEFIRNVEWGELDVLVVDLPPGTGDAQLTMVQKAPLSGGVIVTTPQDVALADVRRGMQMFEEVHVPVLGVVENMSYLVCSSCGHKAHVFSHGGGAEVAKQFNVPLLGEIPLVRDIVQGGDEGTPIMVSQPEHPQSRVFVDIAGQVLKQL